MLSSCGDAANDNTAASTTTTEPTAAPEQQPAPTAEQPVTALAQHAQAISSIRSEVTVLDQDQDQYKRAYVNQEGMCDVYTYTSELGMVVKYEASCGDVGWVVYRRPIEQGTPKAIYARREAPTEGGQREIIEYYFIDGKPLVLNQQGEAFPEAEATEYTNWYNEEMKPYIQ